MNFITYRNSFFYNKIIKYYTIKDLLMIKFSMEIKTKANPIRFEKEKKKKMFHI